MTTATGFSSVPLSRGKAIDPCLENNSDAGLAEPSDEALLSFITSHDQGALGHLFRRYAKVVHSIGRRILRDPAEAEDFVQEVFLHIFRKAHLYDASKGSARGWIVQTSYYQALHCRAHLNRSPHYGSSEFDEMEADGISAPPMAGYDRSGEGLFGRARWRELIECLTEEQWDTFRLHFYEGYTFDEISQIKNQTVASVRHHFYRGLDRLRKHVFASELRDS